MPCSFCGGCAHPATGCQYSEKIIACRRCVESFWGWMRQHTNGKARRKSRDGREVVKTARTFYESIGGPQQGERYGSTKEDR